MLPGARYYQKLQKIPGHEDIKAPNEKRSRPPLEGHHVSKYSFDQVVRPRYPRSVESGKKQIYPSESPELIVSAFNIFLRTASFQSMGTFHTHMHTYGSRKRR